VTVAFRDVSSGSAGAGSLGLTVPLTVKAGDTCLVFYVVNSATAKISGLTTSGKSLPQVFDFVPFTDSAWLMQFTAAAADAGANISFVNSANAASVALLLAYSGAGLLTAGQSKKFTNLNSLTAASPVISPLIPGSWSVALATQNNGTGLTYNQGSFRVQDAFAISAAYDSNGPVTSAGGGLWSNAALGDWSGFTAALSPAPQPGLRLAGMRFPPPGMFS
jgi:hypothetical protein